MAPKKQMGAKKGAKPPAKGKAVRVVRPTDPCWGLLPVPPPPPFAGTLPLPKSPDQNVQASLSQISLWADAVSRWACQVQQALISADVYKTADKNGGPGGGGNSPPPPPFR
jgi:hypothetical protein